MKTDFTTLKEKSDLYRENNDCTVKMVALVLNTSYEDAWNLTKFWGRKPRKGMVTSSKIIPRLKDMGLVCQEIPRLAKTVMGFERLGLLGNYIITTHNHVLYHKDGKTFDWTEGRQHRITKIWKVTGEAWHRLIDPECNTLEHDFTSRVELCKARKERKPASIKWKCVRKDNGEVIEVYKRKPNAKIKALLQGGLWIKGDRQRKIELEIRQVKQLGGRPSIAFSSNHKMEWK